MRTPQPATAARPRPAHPRDEIHIVGGWQHLLDRLAVKAPTALCGVGMDQVDEPGPNAPTCPACVRINGHDPARTTRQGDR